MLDTSVTNAVMALTKEIKKSHEYREYEIQLEKIKRHPKLYEEINDFRMKNYELQTQESGEELFDEMDRFEMEYRNFIENPIVSDFLRAELTFCRMMQELNLSVASELDFE